METPQGFYAGACHCGIRKNQTKNDVALIYSSVPCQVGAVYTKNVVKADPLLLNKETLKNHEAQAVIVNSGNANACALHGMENAIREQKAAAKFLDIAPDQVLVASTGVIGVELPVECIEENLSSLQLGTTIEEAANAIMTTDTTEKIAEATVVLDGKSVRILGICKGSGMIHPNMGTMLAFILTDCAIDHTLLQKALLDNTNQTFNRVSVDGDTSTNDMCLVMANGLAGNPTIVKEDESFVLFQQALKTVMESLAVQIAKDGEGASRLITCRVKEAKEEDQAETLAKAVVSSSLCKAAMFGHDANWGRVLCAMGYSGAEFDPALVDVAFASACGCVKVCAQGKGVPFSEELAAAILSEDEIDIEINLHEGNAECTCWGCDLTYDYVKINGDYRT
ncbi:bifunctional glutamate N-acetyltransferase/amino-acid acetyltransferase ArgJ [Dubosiella muris]|uniref:Bifunctional glutamate N-acetyltransferase/amino-acid acetyltransferase ArgJ n=1 Tax=Dubosiella muris TaxID=3038133 RepID=A0AC61R6N2_9FIRM|nr:bifunctional glutamate N-acetyltransferase/amino-acid acetyltransferase ArgJ [Dubosiella muris]TGY65827.1 bifunctional glutamate N-acetyltransferase/amino-acid acetyltransferase ArgJ [Dubosiella muris]